MVMKSKYKVADVLELEQQHLSKLSPTSWHFRTLQAIRRCRTPAMGGHIDQCNCCNKHHISFNSCRNRHCPNCQGHKREQWIRARERELLNVPYFHVVFTLPSELNNYALRESKIVYDALFKASWQTLQQFGANPKHLGARMGMIAVLHTWGQNLSLHPHLHCIVPGGGVTSSKKWKKAKSKGKYLFNTKSMAIVFRAKYVSILRKHKLDIPQSVYDKLFSKQWVVHAEKPFLKPQYVIEYLGRYTHKIAISNYRIKDIDKDKKTLSFYAKNYKKAGKKEVLQLSTKDFIKRFALHILPKGFTRIRHFGILSSSWKKVKLPELQQLLSDEKIQPVFKEPKLKHRRCPSCKKGRLEIVLEFDARGPPKHWKEYVTNRASNI